MQAVELAKWIMLNKKETECLSISSQASPGKPVWSMDPYPSSPRFSIAEAWITKWSEYLPVNGDLVLNPNTRSPGFEFRRHK
jgi:hypothetical protein